MQGNADTAAHPATHEHLAEVHGYEPFILSQLPTEALDRFHVEAHQREEALQHNDGLADS